VTQTYKSGSPAVSGVGEKQGVVLLGVPGTKIWKVEPRSQRPGLKLGRQAKQKILSGHTSFGDQGCSEKCCGKN